MLPLVDFHILEKTQDEAELYLAKLIEKMNSLGTQLFIFTNSKEHAERIDNILWTFTATSFLPHHIIEEDNSPAPILISYGSPPTIKEVLINLSSIIPTFFQGFNRIIELVYEDPDYKKQSRIKYRQYQGHECKINTLK